MASPQPTSAAPATTDASSQPPTALRTADATPNRPRSEPQDRIEPVPQSPPRTHHTQAQSPPQTQTQNHAETQVQIQAQVQAQAHPVPLGDDSTLRQRLKAGENHWQWKVGLRALLAIISIIAIGCAAWAWSTVPKGPYADNMDNRFGLFWALLVSPASFLWCLTCILVLFLRRPNKPVHPGVAVGLDLILWLAFIPAGLFMILAVADVRSFGDTGTIGSRSSYGYYEQAQNGTWVWNATEYSLYYGGERDCSSSGYSRYYYSYGYGFASCADEDAYVNALWAEKPRRVAVETLGAVCQFIGLVGHFALFVWACVDTHRRRRQRLGRDAEVLAGEIVMNMVRSGALVQAPQQVARGYSVLPDGRYQQWPPGQWVQVGQHWQWTQPGPSGASNVYPMQQMQQTSRPVGGEKGLSERFA